MKIYEIYVEIPEDIFTVRYKYFLSPAAISRFKRKKDKMKGFYAWTNKKKIVKDFFKDRERAKDIYTLKVKDDVDESDISYYKDTFYGEELLYHSFHDLSDDTDIYIATTEKEYDVVMAHFYDFAPKTYKDAPYMIFKNDIMCALDHFAYTSIWAMMNVDSLDTLDLVNYQSSYRLGLLGKELYVVFENNDLQRLIYIFDYFFLGRTVTKSHEEGL